MAVTKATTQSHVMQYGDVSWTSEPIGNYIGGGKNATTARASTSNVRSRDIPMHLAYYKYLRADKADFTSRMALAKELHSQVESRMKADQLFHDLVLKTQNDVSLFEVSPKLPTGCNGDCCEKLQMAYHTNCGGFDDYTLQYNRVLVNLCVAAEHKPEIADKIAATMVAMCK